MLRASLFHRRRQVAGQSSHSNTSITAPVSSRVVTVRFICIGGQFRPGSVSMLLQRLQCPSAISQLLPLPSYDRSVTARRYSCLPARPASRPLPAKSRRQGNRWFRGRCPPWLGGSQTAEAATKSTYTGSLDSALERPPSHPLPTPGRTKARVSGPWSVILVSIASILCRGSTNASALRWDQTDLQTAAKTIPRARKLLNQ